MDGTWKLLIQKYWCIWGHRSNPNLGQLGVRGSCTKDRIKPSVGDVEFIATRDIFITVLLRSINI